MEHVKRPHGIIGLEKAVLAYVEIITYNFYESNLPGIFYSVDWSIMILQHLLWHQEWLGLGDWGVILQGLSLLSAEATKVYHCSARFVHQRVLLVLREVSCLQHTFYAISYEIILSQAHVIIETKKYEDNKNIDQWRCSYNVYILCRYLGRWSNMYNMHV